MIKLCLFTLAVVILSVSHSAAAKDYKVVCYYGTWATYRHSNGKFEVEHIDPFICTHIIYTFMGLSESSEIKLLDPYLDLADDYGRDNIGKFIRLKNINPDVKLIAAIGGWNEGSVKYSKMANRPDLRAKFVKSAVDFVLKYKFDGLDMDWEYPAQRDGADTDKTAFTRLLRELRTEFDKHGLLLSAAVASAEFSAAISYDIIKIQKYLDFINVMAYDLHGPWENFIGLNAPMRALSTDDPENPDQLTVEASINYWLSQGADPRKVILGMPLYGHTFQLADKNNISIGATAYGAGVGGPYTGQSGFMGYNEYCEIQMGSKKWTEYWHKEQLTPYAVQGNYWFGFDNEDSIGIKTQYVVEKRLGGAMVWSIETDDFRGLCHGVKYPLLRKINSVLKGYVPHPTTTTTEKPTKPSEPTTTTKPNTTTNPDTTTEPATTTKPDTTRPPTTTENTPTIDSTTTTESATITNEPTETTTENLPDINCTEPGLHPDPNSCTTFYECIFAGHGEYILYKHTCPHGLYYDPNNEYCNWPDLVDCEES